jgi:hypothetical protein
MSLAYLLVENNPRECLKRALYGQPLSQADFHWGGTPVRPPGKHARGSVLA